MFEIEMIDDVALVRMVHGRVNAMDMEFCERMLELLDQLQNSDCLAVLLTGRGQVFSAGIDLKRLLSEGPEYVAPFLDRVESVFRALFCFEKPLVAMINGPAIAGGCMMALACDYRLIAPAAKIGIPELRVGVPLPMTAVEMVRFVASGPAFQRIVNVGATYAGEEAVAVGLADQVVESERMQSAALAVVDQFRVIPPPTYRFSKRQIRLPVLRAIDRQREELLEEYLRIWTSPEIRQSVQCYVDERLSGRKPVE